LRYDSDLGRDDLSLDAVTLGLDLDF